MLGKLEISYSNMLKAKHSRLVHHAFPRKPFDIVCWKQSKTLSSESNDPERNAENGLARGLWVCVSWREEREKHLPMPIG
jgi:hypothetical protein